METQNTTQTKEQLRTEFKELIQELIRKGKLKYYPFSVNINSMNKDRLIEGIKLYKEKL